MPRSSRSSPIPDGHSPKTHRFPRGTPHPSFSGFPLSNGVNAHARTPSIPFRPPIPIRKPKKLLYLLFIFFLLYWFGIRHGLGVERTEPPPLGFAVNGGRRNRKSSLLFDSKGLATLVQTAPGQKREHPIYELMEKGEAKWTNLLASQSRTLQAASAEYKRRYILDPPAGFDAWFAFCQAKGVKIVDNYDQMMKDLLPHHALDPELFIKRSEEIRGDKFTYDLEVSPERIDLTGERAWSARPRHIQGLIEGFKAYLPEGFRLKLTGSDHDAGSIILGKDQRDRAMELVKEGKCECFPEHASYNRD